MLTVKVVRFLLFALVGGVALTSLYIQALSSNYEVEFRYASAKLFDHTHSQHTRSCYRCSTLRCAAFFC